MNSKSNLLLAVLLSCASIALVALYFFFEGSPANQHHLRKDQQRLQDLTEMVGHVHKMHGRVETGQAQPDETELDSMLESLDRQAYRDPETGEKYQIQQVSDTEYEICMNFNGSYTEIDWTNDEPEEKLKFTSGMNCFRFSADENLGWGLFQYRYR